MTFDEWYGEAPAVGDKMGGCYAEARAAWSAAITAAGELMSVGDWSNRVEALATLQPQALAGSRGEGGVDG